MESIVDNIANWEIPAEWQEYSDVLPCRYESRVGLSWMTRRELHSLFMLLHSYRSPTVLEIGSASGVSISILAEHFPRGTFISVDDYSDSPIEDTSRIRHEGTQHDQHRMELWYANAQPNQSLLITKSENIRKLLSPALAPDLVIVDGSHTEEDTCRDLLTALTAVHRTGTIVAHDYNDPTWTGVTTAVDKFCKNHDLTIISTVGSLAYIRSNRFA